MGLHLNRIFHYIAPNEWQFFQWSTENDTYVRSDMIEVNLLICFVEYKIWLGLCSWDSFSSEPVNEILWEGVIRSLKYLQMIVVIGRLGVGRWNLSQTKLRFSQCKTYIRVNLLWEILSKVWTYFGFLAIKLHRILFWNLPWYKL